MIKALVSMRSSIEGRVRAVWFAILFLKETFHAVLGVALLKRTSDQSRHETVLRRSLIATAFLHQGDIDALIDVWSRLLQECAGRYSTLGSCAFRFVGWRWSI